jgi:hypothetical protein
VYSSKQEEQKEMQVGEGRATIVMFKKREREGSCEKKKKKEN